MPLHHVQEMLGHSNLKQTSTYLNANLVGLHESMRKFEEARVCTNVAQKPFSEPAPSLFQGPSSAQKQLTH